MSAEGVIRSFLAVGAVVVVEGVDVVTIASAEVTIHWTSVFDLSTDHRITRQRDYWDSAELQAQLA